MKLIKKILFLLLASCFTTGAYAAGANINVTSSAAQVIVGNKVTVYVTISSASALGSWEYTLDYDSSVFKLASSDVGVHYASVVNNASTKSVSYKYTFVAQKAGTGTFSVYSTAVTNWDGDYVKVSTSNKKVTAITYAQYQASLSSNNNLKSLSVNGYEIIPVFDKNTLEYKVNVAENEKKVTIKAAAEDTKAHVSGTGEVEVSEGSNSFNIVVVAENGSEKTYKLIVEVIDQNPISVKVDGTEYVVVKLANNLVKPETYTETKVVINDLEIPAFYSEITEFTLVGLKDAEGNISLFIYKNGKYKKYNELSFGSLTVYPLEIEEELEGYFKTTVKIGETEVDCQKLSSSSRFSIIHGLNVETKEDTLYMYDEKDNSLVKYDDENILLLNEKIKNLQYLCIGFASFCFVSLIVIISLASKKGKKKISKKVQKEEVKEEKVPENTNEEETKSVDTETNNKKEKKNNAKKK